MLKSLLIGVHLCLSVASAELQIRDLTVVDVSGGTTRSNQSILI